MWDTRYRSMGKIEKTRVEPACFTNVRKETSSNTRDLKPPGTRPPESVYVANTTAAVGKRDCARFVRDCASRRCTILIWPLPVWRGHQRELIKGDSEVWACRLPPALAPDSDDMDTVWPQITGTPQREDSYCRFFVSKQSFSSLPLVAIRHS
uniref:Uncharacterized protein n=1 Tax=Dendroctonus ponderosae TaxID=77166 RepID=A0AAR5Q4Q0_DENPD